MEVPALSPGPSADAGRAGAVHSAGRHLLLRLRGWPRAGEVGPLGGGEPAVEANGTQQTALGRAVSHYSINNRIRECHFSNPRFFLFREVNVSRLLSPDFQRSLDLYDSVMDFSKARPEGKRTRGAGGLEPKWTLWGGLYFAGTIYTTIGYGDIVAETVGGKCFTMLYALLGIPLGNNYRF